MDNQNPSPEGMEATLRDAIEFDVPTYETCKRLDWQDKTHFYWCRNKRGELLVRTLLEVRLLCEKHKNDNYLYVLCEAPQVREIAKKLPPQIDAYIFEMFFNYGGFLTIGYVNGAKETLLQSSIHNHHFAQAYIELWEKLKQANLLEKGGNENE